MVAYGFRDSATPENKFQFHCPTVDRDATFFVCAFKRQKHKRGENFTDQDCRTAMCGGKCPVDRMLRHEWATLKQQYFHSTPGIRKLPENIVEELNRIMLFPFHGRGFALTDDQKMRLFGKVTADLPAEILIPAPISSAPKRSTPKEPNREAHIKTANDSILDGIAGATLDATDAINQVMSGE